MSLQVRQRRGFTLLELLVVISIIALLMSLILPAVQSARQSARRVECMNHLRNLSVAMVGYAEGQKRYPAAGYWAGTPGNRYPSHNWCVDLLAYVDRRDLADRWEHTVSYSDSPNGHLGATEVAVFVCPEDDSTSGTGDLSYAVNGGVGYSTFLNNIHDVPVDPFGNAIDLNGNGIIGLANDRLDGPLSDRTILKSLGLFFMENYGPEKGVVRHHTTPSVVDGFSNTLMFVENIRTGRNPAESCVRENRPHGAKAGEAELIQPRYPFPKGACRPCPQPPKTGCPKCGATEIKNYSWLSRLSVASRSLCAVGR